MTPMSLDPSSTADRAHAYETIEAYCSRHALQLVALISCPCVDDSFTNIIRRSSSPAHNSSQKIPSLSLASDDAWKELVAREITEPILLARDFVRMLRTSSGRIILVSTCSNSNLSCKSPSLREPTPCPNHLNQASRYVARCLVTFVGQYIVLSIPNSNHLVSA
jgi:hypothetical protein